VIRTDEIVITIDPASRGQDPRAWFPEPGDTELEIGCGKGGFLLRQARAHPRRNFVGIEWANKYLKYAADRMGRWGVANVRLARADARHVVTNCLAPDCLSALHVYHPDPWPKKRHARRRLFTPEFVAAAVTVLRPGGRWAIQTDHREYFEVIRELTLARPELVAVPFDDPDYGTVAERTETNFETKYMREGRPIYRLAFRRRDVT